MGSVLPRTREEVISFVKSHISVWTTRRLQLGLTEDQLEDLAAKLEAATNDSDAAEAARQASRAATQSFHSSSDSLKDVTAELIRIIKTFAVTSSNPNVYTLAEIPAPTTPGSLPAPKPPIDIKGTIDNNGVLTLRWKMPSDAPESPANFYMVERRLQDAHGVMGDWQTIGGNGRRDFVDPTLPGCLTSAQYRIRTQRSTLTSPYSSTFSIIFGQGGGITTFSLEAGAAASTNAPRQTTQSPRGIVIRPAA